MMSASSFNRLTNYVESCPNPKHLPVMFWQSQGNSADKVKDQCTDAALGKGEELFYEKKLSKEEKKALAKAKREAKKKEKGGGKKKVEEEKKDDDAAGALGQLSISGVDPNSEEGKREAALEELSRQEIVVTYEQKKGKIHANTRDINVSGVSVAFHGKLLVEETDVVINYGNRYGFIGPNGSGKVSSLVDYLSPRMSEVLLTSI